MPRSIQALIGSTVGPDSSDGVALTGPVATALGTFAFLSRRSSYVLPPLVRLLNDCRPALRWSSRSRGRLRIH